MLTKCKMNPKYKRIIAAFLGVCLVLSVSATAWADNGTQSGTSSSQPQQVGSKPGRMGKPNGSLSDIQPGDMPEMPDGERPDDMPEMPDGERPDDMPEMPDGERPDDMPEMPDGERPDDMPEMPDGERPMGGMPGMVWSMLVEDGVISQETCDAIEEYIKENAPDKPADAGDDNERPEPPEKPVGDESDPLELPEDGEPINGIPGLTEELLDALLNAGIITESEYEALLELVPTENVSKA